MELIQSFSPDINGRYTGFWYATGKKINQLNACQFEEYEVFNIYVEGCNKMTNEFLCQSPNQSVWEKFNSGTDTKSTQLDTSFNYLEVFIDSTLYSFIMYELHWIYTNKMKHQKSKIDFICIKILYHQVHVIIS